MSLKNAIGGVLLIAGTTIGAAVLALPIETAHLGLPLSAFYFILCWFFLTIGALYILESNLQMGFGTNLVTMAKETLGFPGQAITWFTYLVLLYSLTAAYLTGAGAWILYTLNFFLPSLPMNPIWGGILCALLVSFFLVLGTHTIDLINRVIMILLFAAFITLVVVIMPHAEFDLIATQQSTLDLKAIPLIITSFGFAIIVPSLTEYLHGNAKQLRNVILIGSLIPVTLYLLWEFLILSVIPQQGEISLLNMQTSGHPATDLPRALADIVNHHWVSFAARIFSIFALITSILGVSLSLFDFLADGLRWQKTITNKCWLSIITFLPPLIFVFFYPQLFVGALSFAGIYVSIILGILPACMCYQGRKTTKAAPFVVPFGNVLIIITNLFFLGVILIEIFTLLNISLIF